MKISKPALLTVSALGIFVVFVFSSLTDHTTECSQKKEILLGEISEAAACTQDSQCTTFTFGCSFGCDTPVNRDNVAQLSKKATTYSNYCHHFCPDCTKVALPSVCLAGRCQPARSSHRGEK